MVLPVPLGQPDGRKRPDEGRQRPLSGLWISISYLSL
jgi:hypothetical protein